MTKLYDLFISEVGANETRFQMRAPLTMILQTLQLNNKAALQRAEFETKNAPHICTFHKNGFVWIVQRAMKPLDVEVDSWRRPLSTAE
jgi:hypothetical protein